VYVTCYDGQSVAVLRDSSQVGVLEKPAHPLPGLRLWPNPVSGGEVTVAFGSTPAPRVGITVFDASGREALARRLVRTRSGSARLDLRHLSSGVYLVRFDTDDRTSTRKLVIQ
jgi:hypothetical protein